MVCVRCRSSLPEELLPVVSCGRVSMPVGRATDSPRRRQSPRPQRESPGRLEVQRDRVGRSGSNVSSLEDADPLPCQGDDEANDIGGQEVLRAQAEVHVRRQEASTAGNTVSSVLSVVSASVISVVHDLDQQRSGAIAAGGDAQRGSSRSLAGPVVGFRDDDEIETIWSRDFCDSPVYRPCEEPVSTVWFRPHRHLLSRATAFNNLSRAYGASKRVASKLRQALRRPECIDDAPEPIELPPSSGNRLLRAINWKDGEFGAKYPFASSPLTPPTLQIPEDEGARALYYALALHVEGVRRDDGFRAFIRNKARAVRESTERWRGMSDQEFYELLERALPVLMLQTPLDKQYEWAYRTYGRVGIDRTNMLQKGILVAEPTFLERLMRPLFPRSVERSRMERAVKILPAAQ